MYRAASASCKQATSLRHENRHRSPLWSRSPPSATVRTFLSPLPPPPPPVGPTGRPTHAMAFVTALPLPAAAPRATPSQLRRAPAAPLPRAPRHATLLATLQETGSQLTGLQALTTVVEDTGDINDIAAHSPHSATTNPTLVTRAAAQPEYAALVQKAVAFGAQFAAKGVDARLASTRNKLFTLFGTQILQYVPGDVSTEVDARLSFDAGAMVDTAEELIGMYEQGGVQRERVLSKLASTWEGVEACRVLEARGIRTNMTLIFCAAQGVAAAQAGAFLISPFVGRITDWHKQARGVADFAIEDDPGVKSVHDIFHLYKCRGWDTIVMGASFRSKEQVLALAGCDRLTISPKLIDQLRAINAPVDRKLFALPDEQCALEVGRLVPDGAMDEKTFRWLMNQDAMATEKFAQGVRSFAADLEKLDAQLLQLIDARAHLGRLSSFNWMCHHRPH